ncbi:MAG: hypothetical protein OEO83_15570 [Alphaproteobacteria bacterium]|nr:hypothetical protein [Alphaproteobacteria bacterium]
MKQPDPRAKREGLRNRLAQWAREAGDGARVGEVFKYVDDLPDDDLSIASAVTTHASRKRASRGGIKRADIFAARNSLLVAIAARHRPNSDPGPAGLWIAKKIIEESAYRDDAAGSNNALEEFSRIEDEDWRHFRYLKADRIARIIRETQN